jgi:hypothetical protein
MVTINCKEGLRMQPKSVPIRSIVHFFTIHTAGLQDGYVDVYDLAGKLLEHTIITSEATNVASEPPGRCFTLQKWKMMEK